MYSCSGSVRIFAALPTSTIRPSAMTATRCGDRADERQVVGHEQHRQPEIALQVGEQLDDGSLHEHIQGGRDLVTHEHVRLAHQRPGDGHALAFPARQLIGVAIGVRRPQRDALEHLPDRIPGCAVGDDLAISSGRATVSPTVRRGFNEL